MLRLLALSFLLIIVGMGFACTGAATGGGGSPTEAYKQLYAAVKAKDIEGIKRSFSKQTNDFAAMAAGQQNSPVEKVYENGFTATTFAESLPPIRDERIQGEMGAVEVWNSKESKWEDLPFVKEDGSWKLAVGEMFGGTYKSPGKGRDMIEKEAANAVANTTVITSNANTNSMPAGRNPDKNAK